MYYYIKDIDGNDSPDTGGIKLIENITEYYIPADPKNKDYQIYLDWKADGNTAQTEV